MKIITSFKTDGVIHNKSDALNEYPTKIVYVKYTGCPNHTVLTSL